MTALPSAAPALLRVRDLTKHFKLGGRLFGKAGVVRAVDGIDLDLAPGETLGLVGESGCGKSTTGRLILNLIEPTGGSVEFEGREIAGLSGDPMRALRRDMQIVFQDPYASLNPRMTVRQILAEPLMLHGIARGAAADAAIEELMGTVGLRPDQADRYPHEFSGGQRQRIGIARALAVKPKLIICDEPVSALDVSIQAQVMNLLKELQGRFGLSYLFIAHDLAVVKHIADRIAVMYLGKIVELAPAAQLFAEPRHPYTRALLSAIPVPDPTVQRRRTLLEGDTPSPARPPSGCRFRTRCPYARPRCAEEMPVLAADAAGHATACHFWPEIAAEPAPLSGEAEALPYVARLQDMFARGGQRPN